MIRVLVKEDLVDHEFIDKWCVGYEELVKYCERFTPEYVEKETGVPAEKMVAAARMFADGPSAMQLPGQSVPHQHNGCNNVRAMSLLMALTGNAEKAAARFSRAQLENSLCILQQLDLDLKRSKLDSDLLLQKALCQLALAGGRR